MHVHVNVHKYIDTLTAGMQCPALQPQPSSAADIATAVHVYVYVVVGSDVTAAGRIPSHTVTKICTIFSRNI